MKIPENEDRIALEIYEEASKTDQKRRYLGASSIGHPCDRHLWYGFRGFTRSPMSGRVMLIFELGHHIEDILAAWLERAGYRITEKQREFRALNGYFRGHWDGKIEGVTSLPHVWDSKSCNDAQFKAFKQSGMKQTKYQYYAQAQVYMHLSGLERAIFTFYNKNTSELWNERVRYSILEAKELMDKASRIIQSNEIPERAFTYSETTECKWCDYRSACWNSEEYFLMSDDKVCGSCWYLWWSNLKPCCTHPDHPFFLHEWGMICPDWSYLFDKSIGPHQVERKPKVDLKLIVESE